MNPRPLGQAGQARRAADHAPSRAPQPSGWTARLAWLPLPLACLLLAGALVFQYHRSREYDTSAYFENVALLRQIRQLDAHWELDAMKSKLGLNQDYDPLVDPLPDLGTLPRQLGAMTVLRGDARNADDAAALAGAVEALQQALKEKSALVESFKSHNAVLRNSQAFLPTAAADAGALAPGAHGVAPSARSALRVERVLLDTLIYNQGQSDAGAQAIEAGLAALEALRPGLPADQAQRSDIFVAHVRTVLREDRVVNRLLARIDEAPTMQKLDAISLLLADEQRRAVAQLQAYRHNLLLLAGALAGLLLFAAVRLVRGRAIIGRINAALAQSNQTLEQRVRQRTDELSHSNARLQAGMDERELLENRLAQSEKLASIGQLAAGIAHEIDHPMALLATSFSTLERYLMQLQRMLAGYRQVEPSMPPADAQALAQLRAQLELEQLAQQIRPLLAGSHDGMERVGKIVRDLRDFSHVDTDQQWQWADVRRTLASAIGTLAGELRAAGELRTDFGDMPDIECLPSQLDQVFVNLLRNAAQAIAPGQGRITVRAGGDDDLVWIEVIDTGRGIAPQIESRIFDPFFTTRAAGKGTGLGLSLCYGIVAQHGGRIDVESAPGQGSTFRVTLPVRRAVAARA